MTEGTDMNQIEKVARAIWDQQRNHWGHYRDMVPDLCKWEELTQSKQRELMREAKAAIAAMPVQAEPQWQGIESAPDLERVIVAGWNPHSGNVRGYWWYGEDVVSNGRAIEHPRATHWRPFNNPAFPAPPAGGTDAE